MGKAKTTLDSGVKIEKRRTFSLAGEQIERLRGLVSVMPFLRAASALILLHLFVKTLDMEKPEGWIHITCRQLQNLTGLSAPAIISAVKDLITCGLITVEEYSGRKSKAYRLIIPDDAGVLKLMRRKRGE